MMSLRNISSLAVNKYGIAWDEMPQPLFGELNKIEERIKSELTGDFVLFMDWTVRSPILAN